MGVEVAVSLWLDGKWLNIKLKSSLLLTLSVMLRYFFIDP